MSSGQRPMGAAKGKQIDTEALCHPPPPLLDPHPHPFSKALESPPPVSSGSKGARRVFRHMPFARRTSPARPWGVVGVRNPCRMRCTGASPEECAGASPGTGTGTGKSFDGGELGRTRGCPSGTAIGPLCSRARGPLQLRGRGGPLSRCELGEGGGLGNGLEGPGLVFPRCQKKTGGEPDLPSLCVKSRVSAISVVLRCFCGGPGPWSVIRGGGSGTWAQRAPVPRSCSAPRAHCPSPFAPGGGGVQAPKQEFVSLNSGSNFGAPIINF